MTEENKGGGLLVIGAGLPRTGTLSTRAALQHLLGGPCYHGAVPTVTVSCLLAHLIFDMKDVDEKSISGGATGPSGGLGGGF